MAEQALREQRWTMRTAVSRYPRLTRLAWSPRLFVVDGVVDGAGARRLASLGHKGQLGHGVAGHAREVAVDEDPLVEQVTDRVAAMLQCDAAAPRWVRFRHYARSDYHPPHHDDYVMDGHHLIATALLYLTDVESGGATCFPDATPAVAVIPRAGRLVLWVNRRADGSRDEGSSHFSATVEAGDKVTLTWFVYGRLDDSVVRRGVPLR